MNNLTSTERGAEQLDELYSSMDERDQMFWIGNNSSVQLPEVPAYVTAANDVPALGVSWPQPKQITNDVLPVAPLTPVLLPKTIADFVFDEAERMPCPPDYIAAALIVALGSVVGAACAVKPKRHDDSWLVTANLWGGVVGEPSSRKSPAISTAMRQLDRLEALEAEKLEKQKAAYSAELAAYEAVKKAIEGELKKAVSGKADAKSKDDRVAMAKHDLAMLQPPEEPGHRRFKCNDSTTEKLGDLLATNPSGLLILRDELVGLLASWDKPGHEGDRAFYLEGWNGTGSFNIDRISRGSVFVPNLCLSVFGGIQPDLLARYLAGIESSLDNDGRIQRFQVMVYPDATPWRWQDRTPAKDSRAAIRAIFDHLAHFDPVMDGARPADEFVKLPSFSFDDEAQAFFIRYSHDLHTVRIAAEGNPLMRQHLAKYEKLFCSIALIFHLADGQVGDINVDTALRAAGYCEYLETHARRIYGLVDAATVTAAQLLGRRLAEGKLNDGFTARDVRRKRWGGLGTAAQVEATLDVLEEFGWVSAVEQHGGAGRPTTTYFINPNVSSGT